MKISTLIVILILNSSLFSESLKLSKETENVTENIDMYYYIDHKREINWEKLIGSNEKIQFNWLNKSILNVGHVDYPIWIKVPYFVEDNSLVYFLKIGFPSLEDVELRYKTISGRWAIKKAGRFYPHVDWDLDNRNIVFNLGQIERQGDIYLKVTTRGGVVVPISFFTNDSFHISDAELYGFELMFIGLLIGMLTYNLMLCFLVKDKAYLYYAFYIFFVILWATHMNGILYQFFFREDGFVGTYAIGLFISCAGIFGTLFTVQFLDKKHRNKKAIYVRNGIICSWIFLNILIFFIPLGIYFKSVTFGVIINAAFLLYLASSAAFRGSYSAKVYLFSWGIALSCVVYYTLMILGYISATKLGTHIAKIGIASESILLSIALASKLREIETQKINNFLKYRRKAKTLSLIKDEFLANTAHELKTPLHGIIGLTNSLLVSPSNDFSDEVKKNLSLISRSGKRLSFLINDILDLVRLKHKDISLNIQLVDPFPVIEQVLSLLDPMVVKPNVKIVNAIPQNGPWIRCDENRLYQIFFNLISNSIKFTHNGSITISSKIIGEKILFSIHDTGIGIDNENKERIFDRFEQVGSSSKSLYNNGVGLGLPIAKKLIELHSGSLELFSGAGKGTLITFSLPYAMRTLKEVETIDPQSDIVSLTEIKIQESERRRYKNQSIKHILIVDDEEINIQILVNYLCNLNYSLDVASNGLVALEKCAINKYDLILLDVMMPYKTGYEVCRELRETYTRSELPIILLTARNQNTDFAMGFSAGANEFLTKPFDQAELLARIGNLLELKTVRKDIFAKEKELDEVKVLANTDELTGLRNRRSFLNKGKTLWENSISKDEPLCLLMLDIDYFKSVNDTYGHLVGDQFLAKFAEILHFSVRDNDLVARYGGEEFIILLTNTDFDSGLLIAERIRKAVESMELIIDGFPPLKRTVSVGIAYRNSDTDDFEKLIKRADDLLYTAKEKGRNKIQFFSNVTV